MHFRQILICAWLMDRNHGKFLHHAPSHEFYVRTVPRPNCQNNRVWIESDENEKMHSEMTRNQAFKGILIIFTA